LKKICIAIDGPAGSGKSTIAKILSKKLKILYIDTGAMYRAVAYYVIKCNKDTKNSIEISNIVKELDVDIDFNNGEQRVLLNNEDITDKLRTPEISMGASNVAANPKVREKLVALQREIAVKNSVVMDGRDIGSYVLPKAELKIYLNASIEERAKRRFDEIGMKCNMDINDIKRDIEIRDENDKNRKIAPLKKVKEAIEIDTSKLSIDEVVDKIISLYSNINEGMVNSL